MEITCPICYSLIDDRDSNCPVCGAKLKEDKPSNLKSIVITVVIILLILTSFLVVFVIQKVEESTQPKGIEIDGDFSDWGDVMMVQDVGEAEPFNQNVDIVQYGVDGRYSELSFYIRVQGDMLAGEPQSIGGHMDITYIFIDTHQSPQSGYLINGIGADFMVKVEGWQGETSTKNLYTYTSDIQDWNLWEQEGSIAVAVSGSELEAQVEYGTLDLREHDIVDVIFYMQSWDRFEDFSDALISNEEGILLINQQGMSEGVISGNANRLLSLNINALNADIIVNQIKLTRIGKGSDGDVSAVRLMEGSIPIAVGTLSNGVVELQTSIILDNGESITLYVEVDIGSGAQAENTIGFRISKPRDITTNKGTISLRKNSPVQNLYDVSYISSIPQEIKVDGAFAEWEGREVVDDNTGDTYNKNLDIIEYGVSNTTQMVSFYLRVDGGIFWGTPVPYWNDTIIPWPITGEDFSYIYIDSDNESTTGYSIGGIGADHLIEIKGKYSEIILNKHLSFFGSSPFDWAWIDVGSVAAEIDTTSLEIQLSMSSVGITGNFKVYFQTTNWSGTMEDYSEQHITRGT
jgi:hypothetical protein